LLHYRAVMSEFVVYRQQMPRVVEEATDLLVEEVQNPNGDHQKHFGQFLDQVRNLRPSLDQMDIGFIYSRLLFEMTSRDLIIQDVRRMPNNDMGECRGSGLISMRVNFPLVTRFSVLVHEYAHWVLGHVDGTCLLGDDEIQLQAEGVSYVVLAYLGERDPQYPGFFLKNNGQRLLAAQVPYIKHVAAGILEQIEPWKPYGEMFAYTKAGVFSYEVKTSRRQRRRNKPEGLRASKPF
jgi:hypothetical protein